MFGIATETLTNSQPFAAQTAAEERPLRGYAALTGLFLSLCAAFAAWLRASNRKLPDRIEPRIWHW